MTDRFEVSRIIPADASAIFAVLCDPRGHLAIDSSGSIMSVVDEKPVSGVGDTFGLKMHREAINDLPLGRYDVTVVITKFEQDQEIQWTVESPLIDTPIHHFYGYRLRPTEDGTEVTSYYDWSQVGAWQDREIPGLGVVRFPIIPEATLRNTLGILERTVVQG
ncbi:MAG TPA: polyketide cyclase [Sporichthyaceae bacterium]